MPGSALLLDACVTINLAAVAPVDQIAREIGRTFLVTRQAAGEVGHLREVVDGKVVVAPVDLSRYVRDGAFEIIDLKADEIPLYVELAGLVDDGEASTIAVAIRRGLPVATDDRKARRLCVQRGLEEPVGTAALVRQYCTARSLEPADVYRLLGLIRSRASFQPRRSDPDFKWWSDNEADPSGRP